MNQVSIIKLVSGEELVTTVTGMLPDIVVVSPETLLAIPQPPQKPGDGFRYAFLPWGTLTEEGVDLELNRALILYVAPAAAEMVEHYKRAFSKLALPTQGLSIVR